MKNGVPSASSLPKLDLMEERLLPTFESMDVEDILDTARFVDESYSPMSSASDAILVALKAYPSQTNKLEHARAIYTAHANSPLNVDRQRIGLIMGGLTIVDHDYGLSLWDQLIRDREQTVREPIHEQLKDTLEATDPGRSLAEDGLTLSEALRLQHSFQQAEAGRNIHDPRREAFDRFLGRLGLSEPQS
jgi:hypothetical protein